MSLTKGCATTSGQRQEGTVGQQARGVAVIPADVAEWLERLTRFQRNPLPVGPPPVADVAKVG